MLNFVSRSPASSRPLFEKPDSMSDILYELLLSRGISSPEEAESFLHPGREDLLDPMLLDGMKEAAAIITGAIADGKRICVYGDYDVDGVCATAILTEYLKSAGARVEYYLPSRHNEGYGLNECAVRSLSEKCDLLVTVDCGISSRDLVSLAMELGLQVIVTDHHIPPEDLPECTVVDPHIGDYPFPFLCGAGVAFKLVQALGGLESAMPFIDLACLATVADVVPLQKENRVIVKFGLEAIDRDPRPGLRTLMEVSGIAGKKLSSGSISFQLAPRLNAGGRLGSACRSLDLLLEKDYDRALPLAQELNDENASRREIEQKILAEANVMMNGYRLSRHRVILLMGEGWNPGVIGLVASRLEDRYHYPTLLLSRDGDTATGSCRSIDGVDIYAALESCSDLLTRFGGHTKAAGLTVPAENVPLLLERLDAYVRDNCDPFCFVPRAEYDLELGFDRISTDLVKELELLQPTGYGNQPPVFCAEAVVRDARAVGCEGAHLKLTLENNGRVIPGIRFRDGERAKSIQFGSTHKILFVPKITDYPVPGSLEMDVQTIADENCGAILSRAQARSSCFIRKFLTHVLYNGFSEQLSVSSVTPDRIVEWLKASPQGTLLVCTSITCFERALGKLPELVRPDASLGSIPDDPNGFNLIAYCPQSGTAQAFKRVVFMDAMFGCWPEGLEFYRLTDARAPEWFSELPDLDGMRDACRAMYSVPCGDEIATNLTQLSESVASRTSLTPVGALAALKVLQSMELLVYDHNKNCFGLVRGVKKDPADNEVYRTVQRLKAQFEEDV